MNSHNEGIKITVCERVTTEEVERGKLGFARAKFEMMGR